MLKLFFASDIHGSNICFKKFINAGSFYQVDVLILGGDLTAKRIIPLIKKGNAYEANLFGKIQIAETEQELKNLKERIASNGFYSYLCEPDEYEEIQNSQKKQEELFQKVIVDSFHSWLEYAETVLKNKPIKCYVMAGNDDNPIINAVIDKNDIIINPEFKKIALPDGYEMISVGYSNKTPFNSPREYTEEKLYVKISEQAKTLAKPSKSIFNFHCPPYGSGLDIAPEITENLEIVINGREPSMNPVGSTAVRRAIEEFQPLLGLHGHVHESRGATKIGQTLCINPGSEYVAGILRGVIITLDNDELIRYQFVSG